MTNLEIIELVALALIVLTLVGYYSIKAIKNGWLDKLYKTITEAIKTAETTGATGKAKKDFVLKQVETTCEELGIPYVFVSSLVSKLVDTIIKHYNVLTKKKD